MTWFSRIFCVILFLLFAMAPTGPTYDISWYSIDGGGGLSMGGPFDLHGVIGQHDAGTSAMTGGTFALSGGFLANSSAPSCPADVDGNGNVNITDLLDLLANWGVCGGACPEDINNDGFVDVTDLLAMLGAWGTCP